MAQTPTPKRVRVDKFCRECGQATMETCKQCGHTTYCDRCGLCNLHGEPRVKIEPTRRWLVEVTFTPKKGSYQTKGSTIVKANGQVGALAKGFSEVKKEKVKPRTHITSFTVVVTPIPTPRGYESAGRSDDA